MLFEFFDMKGTITDLICMDDIIHLNIVKIQFDKFSLKATYSLGGVVQLNNIPQAQKDEFIKNLIFFRNSKKIN